MSASMPDLSLVQHALTAVINENSPPQLQSLKQSIDFYGKQLEIANPIWKAIQSREAIPADTSPTDWEHIANYWLPTQALVLLSNPDRKLISFGSKKQDYPPIKGIFEEVMAPFRKNHGWANVVEEAGKALAQFRKLEKIAGPSPVLSSSSNDGHIQHIFNQCDALSGTSTLVNIATNLNMAAIYLWWLQKGNLAFPRTLEEFESKLWITLPDGTRVQSLVLPQSMRLRYRSNNWEHPGHLALAISPICLLRGKALSRQSSDRTQVLNTAWCLGPHADRPPMLQKLEKWLWDNLVKMSQGTCTAFAVIENLFGENPWAYKLVKSLTGKDKAFFFNLNPNAGIIPGNAHIEELGPIIDLTNEEDDMLGEAGPSSMRVQQSTGKPASAEAQPFESKMESHELGSTEIIQPQQSKSNELFQEVSVNINHPEMSTSSPNEVEQGDSEMADIPSEVEKSNMDYSHQDATVVIEDTEGLSKGEHHGLDIRMEDVAQNPKDQNANGTQDLEDLSAPELCPLDLTKSQPVPLPPATVTEKLSGMEVQHENGENGMEGIEEELSAPADLATQLQAPLPPGKKVFDQVAGDDLDSGNTFSLSLSAAITGIGVINSWEDESQNEATTRSRVPDESNNQAKKRKRSNTSNDTPSNLATRQSARIEAKKLAGDYQEIFIPVTKSVPQKRAKAASASPSSEKEEIPEFDIQVYSKLIEGETHTLFNHNGRHSLEYTHFAHDNMSLKHLKTVLNSVNAQAKKDGRLLENGTFVPGGDDPNEYPISELSSDSWNCLSPQERQAWFGGNKILVIQRSNLPTSYQLGSKSHLQALVGDLDRVRTIQDGSRHAKKASDTHTHGTLAVMQEVVQSGKKVANCLEIPLLPSTVQYPSGLCTQDVAEAETGHPISHVGKTWGLFASSHALHTSHIDSDGRGTFIQVKVGVKYWIVAVPMSDTDLGQLEAFGEGYDVDMTNSQSWKIYGILLWPGDWLVFPPCTPHFVLTPEAAICHGGHFVSSQTLVRTNYAILQTFVASDLLTNTIDFNAPEGLRLIVQYWSNLIVDNEEDYLEMLKKHDRQIIPHVPNFQLLDDIVAFLSLANIIKLGGVLDVREYRESSSYSSQPGHSVPKGIRHHAAEVKTQVLDIEDWLFRHFHLVLVSSSESSEASDGLETAERLPTLAVRYFAQQTQALLYHKFTTTERGIHGEDQCITPDAVKHAIEAELKDDTEFMTQWPEILKAGGSVEDWVLECQKKGIMHSYVWPESPAGGEYEVVQDE